MVSLMFGQKAAPFAAGGEDGEALLKEARRLRRRRWLTVGGVVLAAAAAAVSSIVVGGAGGRSAPSGHPAVVRVPRGRGPVVDAKALRRRGNLAFVSRGSLWVM